MLISALLAAQHMQVNRKNIEIAANNMAADSVIGFQADKLLITEDREKTTFTDTLSFAAADHIVRDTRPGDFIQTGNNLDVALITPDVYFGVQDPTGKTYYTRSGQFQLNTEHQITHSGSGYPVLDQGGTPITLPAGENNISIASDGSVSADGKVIGTLGAFQFNDPASLSKIGKSLMKSSVEGEPVEHVAMLHQGLESSNVNPVTTMAQLLELQRQDTQDSFILKTYKELSEQQIDDLLISLQA